MGAVGVTGRPVTRCSTCGKVSVLFNVNMATTRTTHPSVIAWPRQGHLWKIRIKHQRTIRSVDGP